VTARSGHGASSSIPVRRDALVLRHRDSLKRRRAHAEYPPMSSSANTPGLVDALNRRVEEVGREVRQANFRARALEAAFARSGEERAWSRVRIAADLRAEGEHEQALRVLDAAWVLGPSEEVERAIFTVAIATHCDLNSHLTAEVIEREQAGRSIDVKFARAAVRLYSELASVTQDAAHHARRDHYLTTINLSETRDTAAAA
jgi:hypothetical protein